MPISFATAVTRPRSTNGQLVGVPVFTGGPVGRGGTSRRELEVLGFTGKLGTTAVTPGYVYVGVGDRGTVSPAALRTAAAAMARAAAKVPVLVTSLADVEGVERRTAAQAVAEGVVLGAYRYVRLKRDSTPPALERVLLLGPSSAASRMQAGAERGAAIAAAVNLGRDLANTPPGLLTARDLAESALSVGRDAGLTVEVLDEAAISDLRLGGLLGVNQGSTEPPRLVKLTYVPRHPVATVALVGKGITYDSGGISLKPSNAMHAAMKMDMTGAAVVLAAMSALRVTKPNVKVVGYLCCTDNMPSGSALKLGDVLTIRNGTTVEIHNTDAEGRLVLADGLCLAVEDGADAIVDVATLTGACMSALGLEIAGLMGNNESWIEQIRAAAGRADEPVWPLPLPARYRPHLDSDVADLKNIGTEYGGALAAGLFLQEFTGGVPWVHLDIAGPMKSDRDDGWRVKGASAFGVRTLLELLDRFEPPPPAPMPPM
jgi:leucyl aminopeptidase